MSWAQGVREPAEWIEEAPTAPPAFNADQLVPLAMPPHMSVKVGIDPATITVGKDGVVRYVAVMRNASGSITASFEGIRCINDEVKTYARHSSYDGWTTAAAPVWAPMNDKQPSKHALAFARQGGCYNRLTRTKEEILKALKERPLIGSHRNAG